MKKIELGIFVIIVIDLIICDVLSFGKKTEEIHEVVRYHKTIHEQK